MLKNNVTLYRMIRFYHPLIIYLKIELKAIKVKSLDYFHENENNLIETFPPFSRKPYHSICVWFFENTF